VAAAGTKTASSRFRRCVTRSWPSGVGHGEDASTDADWLKHGRHRHPRLCHGRPVRDRFDHVSSLLMDRLRWLRTQCTGARNASKCLAIWLDTLPGECVLLDDLYDNLSDRNHDVRWFS
jgi:hypothetical protein